MRGMANPLMVSATGSRVADDAVTRIPESGEGGGADAPAGAGDERYPPVTLAHVSETVA